MHFRLLAQSGVSKRPLRWLLTMSSTESMLITAWRLTEFQVHRLDTSGLLHGYGCSVGLNAVSTVQIHSTR